ncbi:DUF4417 domain-containing protein [uncultured Desulfovibrio sp.]|uniref:DUF4417 domain-containing protein n=1 Tax=uncultured Desulfovibrio sp. TaxID=167968 RepID=UPI0026DAE10C|nr:DUF4417 domain-containing protein [uncultured Desulfovibrio sp.]
MRRSHREQYDVFRSELVRSAQFSPLFEFPQLKAVYCKPARAVPFEKACTVSNHDQWVHFYTHDRNFERIWSNPKRYLPILQRFTGVITPDFSLYREMPLAMQIWNTYRNRSIAYWLQREDVPIIPNVRWGDERTYAFAFEGLAEGGTVAVSTNGTLRGKMDREYFKQGLAYMVAVLRPKTIVNYSQTPDDIFGPYKAKGLEIVELPHYARIVRKEAA